MAEVDTNMLQKEHADIRREAAEHTADIRFNVAERAGDIRREIATESHALSNQIGDGFCNTNGKILETGSSIRTEVANESHALSKQIGDGFCDTGSKILETGSSIRHEAAEHTNEIVKEGLKGDFNTRGDIKDTRYDLATRMTNIGDRVVDRLVEHDAKVADRFFTVGRDTQDIRAQIIAEQQQLVAGFLGVTKDVELQALKTQLDAKQNTQYLADKLVADGEKTRTLINDLKYHDLSRGLVERNTELVNCEQDRRHHRDRYYDSRFDMVQAGFQGQWAQLQSQIQAFQSQLQETRQGMVNFGTMSGQSGQQSSTSNNVR
jgi:hypothetical protein